VSTSANPSWPQITENSKPCEVVREDNLVPAPYDREIQGENDCVAPRTPEIDNILANETEIDFFTERTASGMDSSNGLFDELDILDILKDTGVLNSDILDHIEELMAVHKKTAEPLEPNTGEPADHDSGNNSSSMDNPFFEEFIDLGDTKLFPDLTGLNLDMGEEYCALMLPNVSAPIAETDSGSTQMASHPDGLASHSVIQSEGLVTAEEEVIVIESSEVAVPAVNSPCSVSDSFDIASIVSDDNNCHTVSGLDELFALLSPPDEGSEVRCTDSVIDITFEASSPSSTICSEEIDIIGSPPGSPCTKRGADETSYEPEAKRTKSASSNVDKITQRRIKNNIASRYSRASRRMREKELFEQEKKLIKDNEELKCEVESLTQLTQTLRQLLVQKLSTR